LGSVSLTFHEDPGAKQILTSLGEGASEMSGVLRCSEKCLFF